jgi:putative AlgH/UPF0301 family transcriptional regulator
MPEIDDLSGHFLISLKNQGCRFCSNSLIWTTKHSYSGLLGLVVKKPRDQKMSSNLRIKNDIFTTVVNIRGFEPIVLLVDARDLNDTNSLKRGKGDFLSEYSSSLFPSNSSSDAIRGDIGFSEWISGQNQSEITTNIWLIAPFDRKIVRYV